MPALSSQSIVSERKRKRERERESYTDPLPTLARRCRCSRVFGLAPAEDTCLTWCKKPSDKLSDASASFQQPEYRLSERYRLARKAMLGSLARRECPTLGQTFINGPGFVRRGCLGTHQVLHLSILTEMAIVHRQCHSRARSKSDDDYGICL